jgi:hypothetical protein
LRLFTFGKVLLDDDPPLAVHDAEPAAPRQLLRGKRGISDGNAQDLRGSFEEHE